jgi:hypothetical protein
MLTPFWKHHCVPTQGVNESGSTPVQARSELERIATVFNMVKQANADTAALHAEVRTMDNADGWPGYARDSDRMSEIFNSSIVMYLECINNYVNQLEVGTAPDPSNMFDSRLRELNKNEEELKKLAARISEFAQEKGIENLQPTTFP